MGTVILDIEADNLLMEATKIWVVVCTEMETNATYSFFESDKDKLQELLDKHQTIVGHNILMYDFPVLNRLWGITVDPKKIFDTLIVSRLLLPDRPGGHSLAAWGERLGYPKTDHTDFSKYSEEMRKYCINDVSVTLKLYERIKENLTKLNKSIYKAVELEHEFAEIISRQIRSGFKLNVDKTEALYMGLAEEKTAILNTLSQILPPVKDLSHYKTVVKKKQLLSENSTSYIYRTAKGKICTREFEFTPMNPTSRQQISSHLIDRGWFPTVFTETGLPKVDESILATIDLPEAKLLSRLFKIQKDMGMIKDGENGWLKCINQKTGRVHGDVRTNACNTGRCSHSRPNVAQVSKDKRMREVWEAATDYCLVGVDASGLELRMLGHYLFKYDKGAFAFEVIQGDIHTFNQEAMGLLQRNSAKTAIYALIYGAGDAKLGTVYHKDREEYISDEFKLKKSGKAVRGRIEDNITGYSELLVNIKAVYSQRGYLVGIDGRPLHPRSDYSALNLLIQSSGAIICKQWVVFWDKLIKEAGYSYDIDYRWVASIHDEQICECKKNISEHIKTLASEAMKLTEKELKCKVELDVEGKIGKNWYEVH